MVSLRRLALILSVLSVAVLAGSGASLAQDTAVSADPKQVNALISTLENDSARAKLIGQFVATFHDQLYRVYLPAPKLITVTSKRVQGYVPPVRGYGYAIALVNTWLE